MNFGDDVVVLGVISFLWCIGSVISTVYLSQPVAFFSVIS